MFILYFGCCGPKAVGLALVYRLELCHKTTTPQALNQTEDLPTYIGKTNSFPVW